MKNLYFQLLLLIGVSAMVKAQEPIRPQPKFWFGASAAANINIYSGTTQTLNSDLMVPTAFHNGLSVRPYGSLLFEYRPLSKWGFMLNVGYNGAGGAFKGVDAPCDCPATLVAKLNYIAVEPSLRFAPFSSSLYFFAGAVYNYAINTSFEYTQELQEDKSGDFSDTREHLLSMQIGAGYDFPISSADKAIQMTLSPFISYHPYFGRDPRTVESWSVQTIRAGVAFKIGKGVVTYPAGMEDGANANSAIQFSAQIPAVVPVKRTVKESFPLRNYVFFNEGSSDIPNRYLLLKKGSATDFKEGQFQEAEPENTKGRSSRQMTIYYNILNVLGDRMRSNPTTNVTLIGTAGTNGSETGKEYAETVKTYLVEVFEINPSRITTEGRNLPINSSEQTDNSESIELLNEGDHRVEIISTSPLLMAPLQITTIEAEPIDSRLIFNAKANKGESLKTWSVQIIDEKGVVENYGPYKTSQMSVSANEVLGDRQKGTYTIVMTGETRSGQTVRKESTVHLARNENPIEEAKRFSILFDFDESQTVAAYEKYLREVVAPLIPANGRVIIHGHSDIIGVQEYNQSLSTKRAKETHEILKAATSKAGKKGVKYEVYGFGSDTDIAPFGNKSPEGRSYNRTVIVDIITTK